MRADLQLAPGVTSTIAIDGDQIVTGTTQDCVPILEAAKAMHNEGLHGSSEMKLGASLPLVVIERYCNDRGITYQEWASNREHIRAMLNDPSLAHFRIWPGRV